MASFASLFAAFAHLSSGAPVNEALIAALLLAGGIVLLIAGGEGLVRGAVTLSVRLGVSPLIVGLTVVAFGTSAPELAFNVIATLNGNDELSFGNIVGSNIANIGLVLGIAAIIRPVPVHHSVIKRELPMMLAITAIATACAMLPWPADGVMGRGAGYGRVDGVILLAAFAGFLWVALRTALSSKRKGPGASAGAVVDELAQVSDTDRDRPMWRAVVFLVLGLAGLVAGGQLAERGASGLASALGVSDELIGLTIVAVATSLPELFVSVIAAMRGHSDIAVGNVVGSNIFNLSLVFGATALAAPVGLPAAGAASLGVMCLLSVLLVPMASTGGRRVHRFEGLGLLAIYVGYLGYEVWREVSGSVGG